MESKQYECKDCGRGFRVREEEEKEPKCPGCESRNTAPRQSRVTLPSWISFETTPGSG
jgi:DNA-directed RNA polymerase subunit RPC12/RpoP